MTTLFSVPSRKPLSNPKSERFSFIFFFSRNFKALGFTFMSVILLSKCLDVVWGMDWSSSLVPAPFVPYSTAFVPISESVVEKYVGLLLDASFQPFCLLIYYCF